MKKYTLPLLLTLSTPAWADVDPEYFCHDRRGYEPNEFLDAYSNIATFWKNRENFYELRIAGPDLAKGLELPGKKKTRYVRSLVFTFHEQDCYQTAKGVRICRRQDNSEFSPIWAWGDNVDILASSHPVSKENPLSLVEEDSIRAFLSDKTASVRFRTTEGENRTITLRCDTPSWDWYPHVPLDELGSKAQ